jgi:hypothetical protein
MAERPQGTETWIDSIASQFERAWQAGQRPRIEDYLAGISEPRRALLLDELLRVERDLRRKAGEEPTPEQYHPRFPEHATVIVAVFGEGIEPPCSGDGEGSAEPSSWATASYSPSLIHSVLDGSAEAVGSVPRVLLRDAQAEPETPVMRRSSSEMPADTGRYQFVREIDCGGMGAVFWCRDLYLGRDLAIKVLLEKHRDDRRISRRFIEEAQILGQLVHPGIVPIHALGQLDDGRPYFTMKLVKGRTLAALLDEHSDLAHELPRFLGIFEHVCQTIAYAHARGVIHRDLKPSNIMVGSFGEVQVMDWGLGKVLPQGGTADEARGHADEAAPSAIRTVRSGSDAHVSVAGSLLGTLGYMAPEQARGEIDRVEERADVFGLGAILCEILTGKPPFTGATCEEICAKASRGDLAAALARLDACGAEPDLMALARDCLAAEPADRLRHAGQVARRISAYLSGVQDRLKRAELARAAEEARAKEAQATAAAAERARMAEEARAQEARRRLRWGAASAGLVLVVLLVAMYFAWRYDKVRVKLLADTLEFTRRDHAAREKHLADTLDRALTAALGGDLEGAEQATAVAEQAGASPGQVHMLRGQIALHRGQCSEARQHLENAVQLLPRSVSARGMLASAYAYDGHWERYDRIIREMEPLTPVTSEDFLFKGHAVANLEPERGLQTINQAFDLRPMPGIALLLRADVRALVAQDTDFLEEAEGAVRDAKYAKELLPNNPAALWVSLQAHGVKAGVHEHRGEPDQRRAELELAGKDADALEPFTALPEAVVYRWLYFREVGREEEVREELRLASEGSDHVYVTFCYALTLYRRGGPGDLEQAVRVLEKKRGTHNGGTYNDRLLPFALAERDYQNKDNWPAGAREAAKDFAERAQDGAAVMDTQMVLCLIGMKGDAVQASKALLKQPEKFYILRRQSILRCLRYIAGDLPVDDLVRGAGRSQWDQCLVHYYVAMTKLAEGDRKGAQEHYDMVIKTRAFLWGPYDMSWVFQARLAKDPTWPRWISKCRGK